MQTKAMVVFDSTVRRDDLQLKAAMVIQEGLSVECVT
jgi:hypothetical protein